MNRRIAILLVLLGISVSCSSASAQEGAKLLRVRFWHKEHWWPVLTDCVLIWCDGSAYFHFTVRGDLLYWRMYRKSFLFRSDTEVNTPRAMTSRSSLPNHSST